MDKLITAMAPVFAAGLGIQQLAELLDPILDKVGANYKRVVLAVVSLALGLLLAVGAKLHVLAALGAGDVGILDPLLTGLIISGGTEGVNSIMKFLKYTKEDKKNEAAAKTPSNAKAAHAASVPVPTAAALDDINKK